MVEGEWLLALGFEDESRQLHFMCFQEGGIEPVFDDFPVDFDGLEVGLFFSEEALALFLGDGLVGGFVVGVDAGESVFEEGVFGGLKDGLIVA